MVFWRDLFLVQVAATFLAGGLWLLTFRSNQRKAAHIADLEERLRIADHGRDMERMNYERVLAYVHFLTRQNERLVDCIQHGDCDDLKEDPSQ